MYGNSNDYVKSHHGCSHLEHTPHYNIYDEYAKTANSNINRTYQESYNYNFSHNYLDCGM